MVMIDGTSLALRLPSWKRIHRPDAMSAGRTWGHGGCPSPVTPAPPVLSIPQSMTGPHQSRHPLLSIRAPGSSPRDSLRQLPQVANNCHHALGSRRSQVRQRKRSTGRALDPLPTCRLGRRSGSGAGQSDVISRSPRSRASITRDRGWSTKRLTSRSNRSRTRCIRG